MTEHMERRLLATHGTQDVILPPTAILAAARADYARRARNKDREAERNDDGSLNDAFERYAFRGSCVKAAKSPSGILRAQLRWMEKRPKTALPEYKLSVLHLTASLDNLRAAIALAEKEET